jgi:hypothetical protein
VKSIVNERWPRLLGPEVCKTAKLEGHLLRAYSSNSVRNQCGIYNGSSALGWLVGVSARLHL